jgi:hypothetical protein
MVLSWSPLTFVLLSPIIIWPASSSEIGVGCCFLPWDTFICGSRRVITSTLQALSQSRSPGLGTLKGLGLSPWTPFYHWWHLPSRLTTLNAACMLRLQCAQAASSLLELQSQVLCHPLHILPGCLTAILNTLWPKLSLWSSLPNLLPPPQSSPPH